MQVRYVLTLRYKVPLASQYVPYMSLFEQYRVEISNLAPSLINTLICLDRLDSNLLVVQNRTRVRDLRRREGQFHSHVDRKLGQMF